MWNYLRSVDQEEQKIASRLLRLSECQIARLSGHLNVTV